MNWCQKRKWTESEHNTLLSAIVRYGSEGVVLSWSVVVVVVVVLISFLG